MKMRIKEARERAGYTQTELAAKIGVAPNTFNGYENGLHDPKSKLLRQIASECNTSVDFLLCLTEDPSAPGVEINKAPAPEDAGDELSVEEVRKFLCAYGFIDEADSDISESDVQFVSGMFDMLDAWFSRR